MKKFIAVLLSLVFAFSMCVPAFAADETTTEAYDGDPIIVVRGIDFAGLVREDGSKALQLNVGDIVMDLISKYFSNVFKGDKKAFANAVVDIGVEILDPVSTDKEGNPKYADVHIPKYPDSAANIDLSGDEWADTAVGLFRSLAYELGGENVYLNTFDWRKTPAELAAELEDLIEKVKSETGKDKVDIAACSMGGMITTAYLDIYGTEDIDSVVYLSSAHNGADVVGSAFTGDLVINEGALTDFLLSKTNGATKVLVKALNSIGLIKGITNKANRFITKNKDLIYDELLRETIGTAYGLWSLVPDEYFDEAVEFFFDGCESEYSVAIAELAEVKEFVCSTEEILAEAEEQGVKLSFVSHYNSRQLPIYSGYKMNGDGVLETKRTSGGATVANYGEALNVAESAFVSPDKAIDASTCLNPETTWFVKGAKHVGCKDNSDHTEFAIWLITQDTQPTVTTDAKYPRFINVDANENFIAF